MTGRKRWAGLRAWRFIVELSLTGGAGAVVLVFLGNGFFASIGEFDVGPFLVGLVRSPFVPTFIAALAFVLGAAFEFVCALVAAAVAVLISTLISRRRSRWVAVGGGLAASVVAALLSQSAAYVSAVPIDLVSGAFVFFNLVTATLLLRLNTEWPPEYAAKSAGSLER